MLFAFLSSSGISDNYIDERATAWFSCGCKAGSETDKENSSWNSASNSSIGYNLLNVLFMSLPWDAFTSMISRSDGLIGLMADELCVEIDDLEIEFEGKEVVKFIASMSCFAMQLYRYKLGNNEEKLLSESE